MSNTLPSSLSDTSKVEGIMTQTVARVLQGTPTAVVAVLALIVMKPCGVGTFTE